VCSFPWCLQISVNYKVKKLDWHFCFLKHFGKKLYTCISWLPITRTLINSNLDFLHTFTAILPTVTWTHDNSNFLLTLSNSFSPSDHFFILLFSQQLEPCFKRVTGQKRSMNCGRKHWIYFQKEPCILCLYFFVSPVQVMCPPCIVLIYKLCCLIKGIIPFSKYQYISCCPWIRVVTNISSCRVSTTSRRGIKQQGISFGSIFPVFPNKSSWGPHSL